ncbi:hypothetical protein LP419_12530 [Massilia sp. H-1]|nr:hypothetical protein LP419_12530 [Massilia sp. H-1]
MKTTPKAVDSAPPMSQNMLSTALPISKASAASSHGPGVLANMRKPPTSHSTPRLTLTLRMSGWLPGVTIVS